MTYWRGPVWINTNWFIRLGLLRYGYNDRAELIRQGVPRLMSDQGFREYYDPITGIGLGGKNFSWTGSTCNRYDHDERHLLPISVASLALDQGRLVEYCDGILVHFRASSLTLCLYTLQLLR